MATTPATTTHTPCSLGCPASYVEQVSGSCFKIITDGTQHRADAVTNCKNALGQLASISSQAEEYEIRKLLDQPPYFVGQAWIGYGDPSSTGAFSWADGSSSSYTLWQATPQNGRCATVEAYSHGVDKKWMEGDCQYSTYAAVCRAPCAAPCSLGCPASYVEQVSGSCFKIITDGTQRRADAVTNCKNALGQLASINSQAEEYEIRKLLDQPPYFVGQAWIGYGDPSSTGAFSWADGSSSSYTLWQATPQNGRCATVEAYSHGVDKKWMEGDCQYSTYAAVCRAPCAGHSDIASTVTNLSAVAFSSNYLLHDFNIVVNKQHFKVINHNHHYYYCSHEHYNYFDANYYYFYSYDNDFNAYHYIFIYNHYDSTHYNHYYFINYHCNYHYINNCNIIHNNSNANNIHYYTVNSNHNVIN
uniref:C-type lectin domain-containing protein n=1 Tax=Plectus sambesii TaxID=2011161 RepID=A0A914WVJ9_9BILA